MKSIITAVLLIAAVGLGVYFLFLNKKNTVIASEKIGKELIVGKWKLDSLSFVKDTATLFAGIAAVMDSNFTHYAYEFRQDGKVIRLFKDSVQKDTSRYEWNNSDQLLLKQETDSTETRFTVSLLSKDSLVLRSLDSSIAFFTKMK